MTEKTALLEKNDNKDKKQIIIAGGGPCGAISACYLSQKGYKCDIFEARNDIRIDKNAGGRSINLSLSERGRAALRGVGLEQEIINIGTKMTARMIHQNTPTGDCFEIPYGTNPDEHYLLSVNRLLLNKKLLSLAEKFNNVDIHFQEKVTNVDFAKGVLHTQNKVSGKEDSIKGDLIIGADGLWSQVRKSMMRASEVCYSQTFISHHYKELVMEANPNNEYRMKKGYLHIWPRGEFMMIGLANLDGSFTMTLFMPKVTFATIKTPDDVIDFFKKYFPDSIPLFGEQYLRDTYFDYGSLPLCYIKTDPYFIGTNGVLVGDSAHAIVPFYGQGLNAGLEDVLLLNNEIDKADGNFSTAIKNYSDNRVIHGHAIADMAVYNYWVMRDGVNSRWFRFKKSVQMNLSKLFPKSIQPLYTLVSFSLVPYHDAWTQHLRQEKMIVWALVVVIGVVLVGVILGLSMAL